jgi:hypothetical protein
MPKDDPVKDSKKEKDGSLPPVPPNTPIEASRSETTVDEKEQKSSETNVDEKEQKPRSNSIKRVQIQDVALKLPPLDVMPVAGEKPLSARRRLSLFNSSPDLQTNGSQTDRSHRQRSSSSIQENAQLEAKRVETFSKFKPKPEKVREEAGVKPKI